MPGTSGDRLEDPHMKATVKHCGSQGKGPKERQIGALGDLGLEQRIAVDLIRRRMACRLIIEHGFPDADTLRMWLLEEIENLKFNRQLAGTPLSCSVSFLPCWLHCGLMFNVSAETLQAFPAMTSLVSLPWLPLSL